jgi:hypothetical protein
MAKIDARGWIFQISDGLTPTPNWLEIAGINNFDHDPAANEEATETTVFTSNGDYEEEKMQRGSTLTLEGFREKTGSVIDPGQARVDQLGTLKSTASQGQFRFRHSTDTLWTVWTATVSPGSRGGGNNDKTSWGATFTKSGTASTAAVA